MAKKIGIFSNEQQAISAIEVLKDIGFGPTELKVLAKDQEHSRRLEAETDVDADEVQELAETRDQYNEGRFPLFAAGLGATNGTMNGAAGAVPASNGAGGIFGWFTGSVLGNDEEGIGSTLMALGLDKKEAKECREAIRAGSLIIMVEEDKDNSDEPHSEIGRLEKAEVALRSNGAEMVH
ncbi:general stress protein [Paenibacillus abyssi]|uniref:General stress protein 17M-like domain-containing protein n=1 Tax=Paenibacillus abyssi TaxID=1340531 RepID=A0A917CRS4_9BACL|nr:general stress protein [Paenibacillus abyssi]GGF95627.1 hypothetical protein GCM10010916_11140 [Paenibacillus abyssi]